MPLKLASAPGLLSLQPWAQEVEANQAPVINTYGPEVEKWRQQAWDEMPPQLKQRPDAATLLDKYLYVVKGESGGNDKAVGDGGAAWGLGQSHHIPAGSDATTQLQDIWRMVANNPNQWTDWGEGATYEGKPFGALGRAPYNGGSGGNVSTGVNLGSAGTAPVNFTKPRITTPDVQQLPQFDTQGQPAITQPDSQVDTQGLPAVENPVATPNTANLSGAGASTVGAGFSPTNLVNPETGGVWNGDYRTTEPQGTSPFVDESARPYLRGALEARREGGNQLGNAGLALATALPIIGAGPIAGPLGYVGGSVGQSVDEKLGLPQVNLPLVGKVGPATLAGGALGGIGEGGVGLADNPARGAIKPRPNLRVVQPGETPSGAMGIAGGTGPKTPNWKQVVEQARANGMSDAEINQAFPGAIDAANGIDTGAQTAARTQVEQDAKGAAAKRVWNKAFDVTHDVDFANSEARKAAAKAPEALPEQKPNVLATDETRQAMQSSRDNLGNAAVETPSGIPYDKPADSLTAEADRLDSIGGTARSSTDQAIADAATLAKRLGDPAAEIRRQLQQQGNSGLKSAVEENQQEKTEFEKARDQQFARRASELGVDAADLPFKERTQITADLLRTLDKTSSPASTGQVLSNAEKRAMRTASPEDVAKWRERIADAEIAAGKTPEQPTLQQALELSSGKTFTPPADNPNASPLNMSGQAGQMGVSEAGIGYNGPKPAEGPSLNTQRLNRGLQDPARLEGEGSSIPPPRNPAANAQGGFGFEPKPEQAEEPVHRAFRELRDLVNAPISFLTFGHEPIFRQGVGFALTHPSVAKQALRNLVEVAKNPEAWERLNAEMNTKPWVKSAMDSGFFHEGENNLSETVVSRVLNKIPGMANSRQSARAYLTTLRKAGYEEEAQRMWEMGVRDPAEYKSQWNTISDVTGHGLHRGESISVGGFSPAFSPGAMIGRFRSLLDPFTQSGSFNPLKPGARSVAIRNLIGIGGMALILDGIAKAAGADLKWDLLKTPLGKISVGPSTIDPTAGISSIVKTGAQMYDALQSGDVKKAADSAIAYARGQLGPTSDTAIDTYFGQDWKGSDFNLIDRAQMSPANKDSLFRKLFQPIASASIQDAIKAHGPVGVLIGAPSLGAMSVETNTLQSARDKGAQQLNFGKPYADLLQSQKDQVDALPGVKDEAGAPSAIKQGSSDTKAKYDQQENGAIDQFKAGKLAALPDGTPVQNMPDAWMKLGLERRAAAEQFQKDNKDTLSGIPENDYKRVTEPYYSEQNIVKQLNGAIDFDATAAKRQDYIDSLSDKPNGNGPSDKAIMQDALLRIEGNKSDAHQKYDKYIADRKAAGYFNIAPDDPKANEKRLALDKANPLQDALNWYWKGGTANTQTVPTLNTAKGVDIALQMAPSRPVNFGGLSRPINQSQQSIAAWQEYGPRIDSYFNNAVPTYRESVAKELFGGQPGFRDYSSLDAVNQGRVNSNILSRVKRDNPELEAALQYFGHTKDADGRYTVSSQAGQALQQIIAKYGGNPPQPGTLFAVRN